VVGGTLRAGAQGVRAGVDAITPNIPLEARGNGYIADVSRTAPWRMNYHNNEWWYYAPDNQWMYHRGGNWNRYAAESFTPQGQYATGYRGVDQNGQPIAQGQINAQTQGQAQIGVDPNQPQAAAGVNATGQLDANGQAIAPNAQTGVHGQADIQAQGQAGLATPPNPTPQPAPTPAPAPAPQPAPATGVQQQ
jgi:hypothetical protein